MRIMLVSALLQLAAPPSEVHTNLPTVQISMADLGGTILLINMKHSLVVSKSVHETLKTSLGEKLRAKIYIDIISGTDPQELKEKYADYDTAELSELFLRYQVLLLPAAG